MIDQSKNYLRWVAVFAIIHIATANIGAAADDARESGLQSHLGTSKETSTRVIELSLEQCITIALAENHQRPASRQALAIAEAQHRQVLAAYWPQVHLQAGYLRTDEPPNFLFPPTIFGVPPQSISIAPSGALVTIPTNAFAPGFPPQDVPTAGQCPGTGFRRFRLLFPGTGAGHQAAQRRGDDGFGLSEMIAFWRRPAPGDSGNRQPAPWR